MTTDFWLKYKDGHWYGGAAIRYSGQTVPVVINTVGLPTVDKAVEFLVNDIRGECDTLITHLNKWLTQIEKSGIRHDVSKKEIVFESPYEQDIDRSEYVKEK